MLFNSKRSQTFFLWDKKTAECSRKELENKFYDMLRNAWIEKILVGGGHSKVKKILTFLFPYIAPYGLLNW